MRGSMMTKGGSLAQLQLNEGIGLPARSTSAVLQKDLAISGHIYLICQSALLQMDLAQFLD